MKFIDKKEVDKNALQKWDEDSIRLQRDLIEPYWNVKQGGLYVRNWPHRM